LSSRGKNATIKDFKIEILIYFNSPFTKHWTPYTKHPISRPTHFLIESSNFCSVGSPRRRAMNDALSKFPMCENSTSFQFLSVCSPA
jgi:hypothetical protein